MNDDRELERLWKAQETAPIPEGREMLELVLRQSRSLDRKVRIRNLVECVAALAVAAWFAWLALRTSSVLIAVGEWLMAASGVWIFVHVLRRGGVQRNTEALSFEAHRVELERNYDRQIRLLRTVKYWYLLPPYVGLIVMTVGVFAGLDTVPPLIVIWPLSYTAIFGAIWYLNEVVAVRHLIIERDRVRALVDAPDGEAGA